MISFKSLGKKGEKSKNSKEGKTGLGTGTPSREKRRREERKATSPVAENSKKKPCTSPVIPWVEKWLRQVKKGSLRK